jgi:hypothetical protein
MLHTLEDKKFEVKTLCSEVFVASVLRRRWRVVCEPPKGTHRLSKEMCRGLLWVR